MNKEIEKMHFLFNYDPAKGGNINESYGEEDMSKWLNIGFIEGGSPFASGNGNDAYLMADPEYEKYGENYKRLGTGYNTKPDGSGRVIPSIPSYHLQNLVIYDKFKDTIYGEVFLGKKTKNDINKHEEFISQLIDKDGGYLIYHDSNVEIQNGIIGYGKKNNYSNNSDIGIYFWGSKERGVDPSNNAKYTYFCIIPKDKLYDFQTNLERLTLQQALSKYDYVAQYWKNGPAIVVNTYKETKIDFVKVNK